jgi:S-adenosylmethionine decarboxylase
MMSVFFVGGLMNSLGIHLIVELWDCNSLKLNDIDYISRIMIEAAEVSGATVLNSAFQNFSPQGISGMVIISESHLSIHSWPEYSYAAIDLFTCGTKVDPWKALEYLENAFESKEIEITDFFRGIRH